MYPGMTVPFRFTSLTMAAFFTEPGENMSRLIAVIASFELLETAKRTC